MADEPGAVQAAHLHTVRPALAAEGGIGTAAWVSGLSASGRSSGEGTVGQRESRTGGHKIRLPRGGEQQELLNLKYLRGLRLGGSQKEGCCCVHRGRGTVWR